MTRTILVVDDSAEVRNLICEVLHRLGYQALQASRARDGLEIIRTQKTDLLVLDVSMPEMNGLTMLTHLREMEAGRGIPVILLTAHDERETVLEGSKLGICEFILKSTFSLKNLVARIEHHLGPTDSPSDGANPRL